MHACMYELSTLRTHYDSSPPARKSVVHLTNQQHKTFQQYLLQCVLCQVAPCVVGCSVVCTGGSGFEGASLECAGTHAKVSDTTHLAALSNRNSLCTKQQQFSIVAPGRWLQSLSGTTTSMACTWSAKSSRAVCRHVCGVMASTRKVVPRPHLRRPAGRYVCDEERHTSTHYIARRPATIASPSIDSAATWPQSRILLG